MKGSYRNRRGCFSYYGGKETLIDTDQYPRITEAVPNIDETEVDGSAGYGSFQQYGQSYHRLLPYRAHDTIEFDIDVPNKKVAIREHKILSKFNIRVFMCCQS